MIVTLEFFQLHDQILFFALFGVWFSVTCHQSSGQSTPFFGIYFNHLWWDKKPRQILLCRQPDSYKKPATFISLHRIQKIRVWETQQRKQKVKSRPSAAANLLGDVRGGRPPAAWLTYSRKGGGLMSPSDHIQWSSAAGYLPPRGAAANEVCILLSTGRKTAEGLLHSAEWGGLGEWNHCRRPARG